MESQLSETPAASPARARRRGRDGTAKILRQPNYRQLRHPFPAQTMFSDDEIAAIHDTALRVLEELGMRVLLPEARQIYAAAGAKVVDDMVFIGKDIVAPPWPPPRNAGDSARRTRCRDQDYAQAT
jgi:trimethylamine--corrinoid protein Co-methyltransferase